MTSPAGLGAALKGSLVRGGGEGERGGGGGGGGGVAVAAAAAAAALAQVSSRDLALLRVTPASEMCPETIPLIRNSM